MVWLYITTSQFDHIGSRMMNKLWIKATRVSAVAQLIFKYLRICGCFQKLISILEIAKLISPIAYHLAS